MKLNNLEYRSVMKLGTSSLVITLPREWIEKHNIKVKDIVTIETQRGVLLVKRYGVKKFVKLTKTAQKRGKNGTGNKR